MCCVSLGQHRRASQTRNEAKLKKKKQEESDQVWNILPKLNPHDHTRVKDSYNSKIYNYCFTDTVHLLSPIVLKEIRNSQKHKRGMEATNLKDKYTS